MSAFPSQLAVTFPGARSWLVVSAVLLSAALARPSAHREAKVQRPARVHHKHHERVHFDQPGCAAPVSSAQIVRSFRGWRLWTDTHSTNAFEKALTTQCAELGRVAPPLRAFESLRSDAVIDIRCNHVLADNTSLTWDGSVWLPKRL